MKLITAIVIAILIVGVFIINAHRRSVQQEKLLSRLDEKLSQKMTSLSELPDSAKIPDYPVSFGFKNLWFAVKTNDKSRLAEIFGLQHLHDCNWSVGIDKAYEGAVFITPAIGDWTLICGDGLLIYDQNKGQKLLLNKLSAEFGSAQFFATHRMVEYHCWMKAENGKVLRCYQYLGEKGENLAVEGIPTDIENSLHLVNTFSQEAKDSNYFDRSDILIPNEETVMKIAENWSVDPSALNKRKDVAPGLGLFGVLK